MEFWGVEVKSGEPLKVTPGFGRVLHLSQACLGEAKKEKSGESVYLSVNVDGLKLGLGTLFADKLPQQQFDLVFDRDFEISHNWKSGSVYFYGYMADNIPDDEEFPEGDTDESDSDSEDGFPNVVAYNGKPALKTKPQGSEGTGKANAAKDKDKDADKQNVKVDQAKKNVKADEGDEISDDDSMSEDDDEDIDDEDDESGESDEETPKKEVVPSKKRAAEPASKTPVQGKKAKFVTPRKTDSKKAGVHVATPHPGKQTGKKTPGEKPDQATQKSAGAQTCNSCKRNFNSDKALESHNKAKHSAGK